MKVFKNLEADTNIPEVYNTGISGGSTGRRSLGEEIHRAFSAKTKPLVQGCGTFSEPNNYWVMSKTDEIRLRSYGMDAHLLTWRGTEAGWSLVYTAVGTLHIWEQDRVTNFRGGCLVIRGSDWNKFLEDFHLRISTPEEETP